MAKPVKRRIEGDAGSDATAGRTTAKGTRPEDNKRTAPSTRYTPPTPVSKYDTPSPMWVPVLMFTFFGVGLLTIFLNYTEVLPDSPSQWYLLGGLGAILAGIITATQLR